MSLPIGAVWPMLAQCVPDAAEANPWLHTTRLHQLRRPPTSLPKYCARSPHSELAPSPVSIVAPESSALSSLPLDRVAGSAAHPSVHPVSSDATCPKTAATCPCGRERTISKAASGA